MGTYFNPGMTYFSNILKKYVDKTDLIRFINPRIDIPAEKLLCITRPRRFGKTFSVAMLAAYYDRTCDSAKLFENLKIARDPTYEKHRNRYHVLSFSVTSFISSELRTSSDAEGNPRKPDASLIVYNLESRLREELLEVYPEAGNISTPLEKVISNIRNATGTEFIILIDEWDAIFREFKENRELQKEWLMLLRGLFKSEDTCAIAAAYMTGILPIKRYGTNSAISDFEEFTMLDPGLIEGTFGFTENEVRDLLIGSDLKFDDIQAWYDGYNLRGTHIYNPVSVLLAISRKRIANYWVQTETFEGLRFYIDMDFDGLQEDLFDMLAGTPVQVNHLSFQNDLVSFENKDDILTVLIHLGYLTYNIENKTAYIPNQEIREQFISTLKNSEKSKTIQAIRDSEKLLKCIQNRDEKRAAELFEQFHDRYATSINYNNEECLRGVVHMALFTSVDDYIRFEELPAGKGIADILLMPKPGKRVPALLIELKWNHTADSAIRQIRTRNYPQVLSGFDGEILLVGVTYRKNTKVKKHTCKIIRHVKA